MTSVSRKVPWSVTQQWFNSVNKLWIMISCNCEYYIFAFISKTAQNTAYSHRILHICNEYRTVYAWNVAYLLISNICVPDEHNGPLILCVSVGRHIFSLRNNHRKNTVSSIFWRLQPRALESWSTRVSRREIVRYSEYKISPRIARKKYHAFSLSFSHLQETLDKRKKLTVNEYS